MAGQIVLAVGILHVGQEFGPFARQMHAAPQQVAGRPHLGRIDIGLREHTAAQQHGNLLGVDLVVFGLAAMDGFHIEGMTEDKGNPVLSTEIGKPVPGKDAFDADDESVAVGRDGLEKRLWGRGHVPVHQGFPSLVEDTEVHGAGVEIDTTVKMVLFGVESHEVSSSS